MKKKKKLPVLQYATGGELIYGTNVPTTFTNVADTPDTFADLKSTPYYSTPQDLTKMKKLGYNPESTVIYHPDPNNPMSITLDSYSKPAQAEAAIDKLVTPKGLTPIKKAFGGLINQGVTNVAKKLGANDKAANIIGSGVATATGFIPGMQSNLFQAGDLAGDLTNLTNNEDLQDIGNMTRTGANIGGMFYNPTQVQMAMGGELTEFEGNTHENGGIPLGDGQVQVEQGETKSKDYIYSDRIKLPWNKKLTFADESKRINSKYKDRPEDALSNKSKQIELDKLKDIQEVTKQEMLTKAQKLMQKAGMHQMPDGQMMANNQMAYGGELDKQLGYLNEDIANSPLRNEHYFPELALDPNFLASQEQSPVMDASWDTAMRNLPQLNLMDNSGEPSIKNDTASRYASNSTLSPMTNPDNNPTIQSRVSQPQVGSSNTPQAGNGNFNDGLRTDEKLMPFLPMIGQAATLIGGTAKTNYNEMTPEFVDLKNQRTAAEKQAAIARLNANRNIRNTAGNSGRALTNQVVSNAAIQSNLGDQLGQSYMNEANTNVGIANQANQFNTQIKNEEVNANEMNKARYQEQMIATLANISNAYTGVSRDQRGYAAQNQYNNTMAGVINTPDFSLVPVTDAYGRTTYKYVKTATI